MDGSTVDLAPAPDRSARTTATDGRDFSLLWFGRAISDLGTAVTLVALPVVLVVSLNASTFQVTLLAALSSVVGGLLAMPLGQHVEFRRKRPSMIAADLVRAVALVSVPVAAAVHWLTYPQVLTVAVVNSVLMVMFNAASTAHLKALVSRDTLAQANGKLESTLWFATSIGPAIAGVLIGVIGAAGALLLDAVSFVVGALAVNRIRRPEPPPPDRIHGRRGRDLVAGWRFLLGHSTLRWCLLSYVVMSATVMLMSPLETLLLLRVLRADPWQFGLVMGLPCLAGLAGARTVGWLVRRLGLVRTLTVTGWLRGPWVILLPFAPAGAWGLVFVGVGFAGLLGFAAIHNAALTTYRQLETPDALMARASTAWSISVRIAQPLFILGGGLFAAAFDIRAGLGLGAALMVLCAVPLPWRSRPDENGLSL
jgi:hypothetical protein